MSLFLLSAPSVALAQTSTTSSSAKHASPAAKHHARTTAANKHHAPLHHTASASAHAHKKLVKKVVVVHGRHKVVYQRVTYSPGIAVTPPVASAGDLAGLNLTHDPLALKSNAVLVIDQSNSQVLFEKNAHVALPIASITKLMTSLVVTEAHQDMEEVLEVTADDIDRERNSSSRLRVGSRLSRADMLHIALMSSENRAASALARNYPGGLTAFVVAMNAKAKALGMSDAHYVDSTGLSSRNTASAYDLTKVVMAAYQYPLIRQYSTDPKYVVDTGGRLLQYVNSDHLVANPDWEIGLQKTGYINEAGHCLVMQAKIEGRPIVMVFLDSKGKLSRLADAGRVRKWIEDTKPQVQPAAPTLSHEHLTAQKNS